MRLARRGLLIVGGAALVAVPVWFGQGGDASRELPAGFDVVDGSTLIGSPFPSRESYSHEGNELVDQGFEAIFAVEADPVAVMNAYLVQARSLGMTDVSPDPVESEPGAQSVSCGDDESTRPDDVYFCQMVARTPEAADPRSVRLTFSHRAPEDGQSFSHLVMRYSTTDLHWRYAEVSKSRRTDDFGAGERVEPGRDSTFFETWELVASIEVEPGSRLLAELPSSACGTWTPQAVLQIMEEPRDVLASYVDQLEAAVHSEPPETRDPVDVAGGQLTIANVWVLGGDSYSLRLFEADDGAWLQIQSCYD